VGEVFLAFLRLGLTAFGGPIAHLGHFREEFVVRRRWYDDATHADLVALCQFLPGPASSQVGMAIGLLRAGRLGALAAFVGFTLPSALIMLAAAAGLGLATAGGGGWIRGLAVTAVAVVAAALLGMARTLAATRETAAIAVLGMAVATLISGALGQIGAIVVGGLVGGLLGARMPRRAGGGDLTTPIGRREAAGWLTLLVAGSLLLPFWAAGGGIGTLIDGFWRAGMLVFGGGHVVLPLLEAEFVETGRVQAEAFLAGYGIAQAVPGPLFTFAAFLGSVTTIGPGGWIGGTVALLAIFAPSWLLVAGLLPFWHDLRRSARASAIAAGIDAAVVGLLAAAFYDPVFTGGIRSAGDAVVAAAAFVALAVWRLPPWAVVAAGAAIGAVRGLV
jgi:chromate transporter